MSATPLPSEAPMRKVEEASVELQTGGSSRASGAGLIPGRRGLVASFSYAFAGLLRTLNAQRNMKIHWVSGLAVLLVGMALPLDLASRASLLFCVFIVLCMEVLNTAFEAFVDLHIKEYERTAMIAKDAAAAAVLLLAIAAVVVFSDVLLHAWPAVVRNTDAVLRTVAVGLPLLATMGALLSIPRRLPWIVALGLVALVLLSVLAWPARDAVFAACAFAFIAGAVVARMFEPRL